MSMEINTDNYRFNLNHNQDFSIISDPMKNISPVLLDKINLILSNNKYNNINSITNIIKRELVLTNKRHIDCNYTDIFEDTIVSKFKLNKSQILEKYNKTNINKEKFNMSNIPTELLLNEKQLYHLILTEIEKVNSNMNHDHYIVCNDDNILNLSIRFRYRSGTLSCIMQEYKKTNDYDYFEINFILGRLYPFLPPKVKYIRPNIDITLVHSIINMDIWNLSNWNYMIPLDTLIVELATKLEPYFIKHLDFNKTFNEMDLKILELCKDTPSEKIIININTCTNDKVKNKQTDAWASGTGYGSNDKTATWNISMYIDEKNIKMNETIDTMNSLCIVLEQMEDMDENILLANYIISKFTGINILDFNNNYIFYKNLIQLTICLLNQYAVTVNTIKLLLTNTRDLHDEIQGIVNTDITSTKKDTFDIDTYISIYIYFIDLYNRLKELIPVEVPTTTIIISNDIKTMYTDMIKTQQFGQFNITTEHLFSKMKCGLDKKSMLRVVSEISSLRKNLPCNWDSSVAMRVSKTNANLLSFIITGPKDTPYHNGIFEFHAYLPDGYPSTVPQVLINTTNGGQVRFNPNLYANGKVCLSLLGTWSGEQGESWNPELSTFLQVIISIQSLILVDKPYFNEPGYERSMNTKKGIDASKKYNDNIMLETIRVAMVNQIKKGIDTYDILIKEHFRLKKDEILSTVSIWVKDSIYNKNEIEVAEVELIKLLNSL